MAEVHDDKQSAESFECNHGEDQNQSNKTADIENNQAVNGSDDNDYISHDRRAADTINGDAGVSGRENGECCDSPPLNRRPQLYNGCPEPSAEVIRAAEENNSEENFSNGTESPPDRVFRRYGESLAGENGGDKDFEEMQKRTTSSEVEQSMFETHCNHSETSRLTVTGQADLLRSKLMELLSGVNRIAANSSEEDLTNLVAYCRQELGEIAVSLSSSLTDQVGNESTDTEVEKLDKTKFPTSRENGLSSEDSTSRWRLENRLLQARVEKILLQNRSLKAEVENVEQLSAASRELKSENEALIGEYRDFKLKVLSTRCQECLKLSDQNESDTSSSTLKARLDEKWHVEGLTKGYVACKESRQTSSSAVPLHGKRQSVSALTKIFESQLHGRDKHLVGDNETKTRTKPETDTESTSGTEGARECSDTSAPPLYREQAEEIQSKTTSVQRNLTLNWEFRQEAGRLTAENEKVTQTIVDLRMKMGHETGEVGPLKRKLVNLERLLIEQLDNLSLDLSSMVKRIEADRKRLAGDGDDAAIQISASAMSHVSEQRTSDVILKTGDDLSGVESVNGGNYSTAECREEFSRYLPKSKDDHADLASCKEVASEISAGNGSDVLDESPAHHGDSVLLSKQYVEDLLAEITALKRTVTEQSRYLQTADDEIQLMADVCLVNGERFATRLPGEDDRQSRTMVHCSTSETDDEPVTSVRPIIFDAVSHYPIDQAERLFSVDENGIENQDDVPNIENMLDRSDAIEDLKQTKDVMCGQFRSDEGLLWQKSSLQNCDACIQTDDVDFDAKPNIDAETARKYNAVVANLRKTCDLANEFRPSEGSNEPFPEISEEDYLSVDELLLLINSYEQLKNEKKILEDENRIFGMEIDELASRLVKAEEENGGERSLPSISEENLQEHLAEIEDRLEAKEAELSKLRKALSDKFDSEKALRKNFTEFRDNEEIAEKTNDAVELIEYWETINCIGETGTNQSVVPEVDNNMKNELHVGPPERRANGYSGKCDDESELNLSEKDTLVPFNEHIVTDNEDADGLDKKKSLKAEPSRPDQDLSEVVASVRPEILRLEAENGRLKEEVEKWKRLKQFRVDDAESMFCVQERLASELEQLGRKLESTSKELEAKEAAYRQLEAAYRHLEKEQRSNIVEGDDRERRTESVVADVDVMRNVVDKVCSLQVVNGSLVEETVRLALELERGDLKSCAAEDSVNCSLADKETTEYDACNVEVLRSEPQKTHDSASTWQVIENGADGNSSAANEEQETTTHPVVSEATAGVPETENDNSELVQSRSTELSQPAIDADADFNKTTGDGKSTASTVDVGVTRRPLARDLVRVAVSYIIIIIVIIIIIYSHKNKNMQDTEVAF